MAVGDQLDLDMARLLDILLDEHAVVGEGGLGLVGRRAEALVRLGVVVGDAHALAAAAGRGLDHHRIADLVGDLHRLVGILQRVQPTRHGADAGLLRQLLGFDLVAHGMDGMRLRADEDDAGLGQRLLELLLLGEEAVAGMDRLGAGLPAGFHDLVDQQVGLRRGRRPDQHRLVGLANMQRVGIGLGIHGHGLDAQPLAGTDDAAGDLAAVGDQDLVEQRTALGGLYGRAALVTGTLIRGALVTAFFAAAFFLAAILTVPFYRGRTGPWPRRYERRSAASRRSAPIATRDSGC